MTFSIQLFNFLEDYAKQIAKLVMAEVRESRHGYAEMSEDALTSLVEYLLDAYIDLLVTGQTDALEQLFRLASRVVDARGSQFSDVFELPLVLSAVIRRLLAEEYADLRQEDALIKFNQALEQTEKTAHRAATCFLDVYQEHLQKRIQDHNNYLRNMRVEFGVDLSEFVVGSPAEANA